MSVRVSGFLAAAAIFLSAFSIASAQSNSSSVPPAGSDPARPPITPSDMIPGLTRPELAPPPGTVTLVPTPGENLEDELSVASVFDKDTYKIETVVCPFKGEIDYEAGDISCGRMQVPENREKARPRMIDLYFTKIHAKQPDDWDAAEKGEWVKRDDPIIYLTGGPGAQAKGYVSRLKDHGVVAARDLFILEQRGIGWSGDFCPAFSFFDPSVSNTGDWAEYQKASLAATENCFASAKAARVDLSGYSTIENARDVHALRVALGFDQWNVWGISYGSILGQAYLKQDPDGIRAAVIDAIVPLQQGAHFQGIGRFFQRDLDLLSDACGADADCGAHYAGVTDRFKSAVASVRDTPIEIDAIDTELFPSGKAWFFPDFVAGSVFVQLYEQDNYGAVPAYMDALATIIEQKDFDRLRVATASFGPIMGDFSPGMYQAIACNDNWVGYLREAYERDARDHPILSSINGDPANADAEESLCRKYGMAARDAAEYSPVVTDIRILIVEGEMDPITPPPLAEMILPGFSNGTYVEFAYAGHGPTRSVKCAGEFLTKFYDDPEAELDMSCVEDMEPPNFIAPVYRTDAHLLLAAKASEDPKKLIVPGIWLAASALILFLSTLFYSIAPVARLIDRKSAPPTDGARPLAWLVALTGTTALAGLGYGIYATTEASDILILVGLVGWTKWFVTLGIVTGVFGAGLLFLTTKTVSRGGLPIGSLIGLSLTSLSSIGLALWLVAHGFLPF